MCACLVPESVVIFVVSGLELCKHEIAGAHGGCKKKDLHGGVVHGDKAGEQIQVTGQEH